METHFDRRKNLQELENCDWGEPDWESALVLTCHRLRRKPVNQFTAGDLRILIGQQIGLPFLMPLALEHLDADPLAEADYFPGDLLSAVLNAEKSFWPEHPEYFRRACEIAVRARGLLPNLDEIDRSTVQEVLSTASSVFKEVRV